ncbi:hypothetical protein Angca_002083, partial [Angiostrongylus cantonensis]
DFWKLFRSNIHSQNIPELHKFNYLLNAVRGEALEAVKKFRLAKENYTKAIEFLTTRYEVPQVL